MTQNGPSGAVPVDTSEIEVSHQAVGAAPVVDAVLGRLGFDELVASYLPEPDPRCVIEPARAIGVLVRNLALSRQPLYGIATWAQGYAPELLGLEPGEAARLNDDKVGRALDELFLADRASLLTALSLRVIRRFSVDVSELHNDSTSITLYGAYRDATGTPRAGVRPPVPERGFSKDHRGDLKQLVEILTVSADGAIPIAHRLVDGSTEDSTTHIATWDELVGIVGHPGFTYIGDCKLATSDNMQHIASGGGRFLTILPRTRKEDGIGRDWIAARAPAWSEIARRPGRRQHAPPEVYWAAEAPSCSQEGFRICWVRSSDKQVHDAAARVARIEEARRALAELDEGLQRKRRRLKTRAAVEDEVGEILTETGATRWVRASVSDVMTYEHRQERRGRPGPNTRYRRVEHHSLRVEAETDAAAVAHDAASDGCFPFVTNETLPAAELLRIYKAQPHLERRHATFKGVIEAAPLTLKSDARIDALGLCLYVALLVHALVERELRRAMADKGIPTSPSTTRTGRVPHPPPRESSRCSSRRASLPSPAPSSCLRSCRLCSTRSRGRS